EVDRVGPVERGLRVERPPRAEPREEQRPEREKGTARGRERRERRWTQRRRPPGERAGGEERRHRDGGEVPVDVDERVQQVCGQEERECELRAAPPQAAAQEEGRRCDEQQKPDDPRLREELQRQIVRLGRDVEVRTAVEEVREPERAGAGAAEHVVGEAVPRLLPPDEAEVRARRREAPAAAPDGGRAGALDDDDGDGRGDRERAGRREAAREPAGDARPGQALEQHGGHRAREEERAEDEPVAPADVRRLAVRGDAREGECDPDDDRGGRRRRDERRGALDAVVREREPRDEYGDRRHEAAARVGEEQRDDPRVREQRPVQPPAPERERERERAEQGELVPETDRPPEPRDARRAVVVDRRQHLAEQRPRGERAEEDGEAERELPRPAREVEAEEGEEDVDERAVRVVPGAVGERRPRDRESEPRGERGERPERHEPAGRAVERGGRDERGEGAAAEPEERGVAGPAGEEERACSEDERRGERQFAGRPHLARSYHPPTTCSPAHKSLTARSYARPADTPGISPAAPSVPAT